MLGFHQNMEKPACKGLDLAKEELEHALQQLPIISSTSAQGTLPDVSVDYLSVVGALLLNVFVYWYYALTGSVRARDLTSFAFQHPTTFSSAFRFWNSKYSITKIGSIIGKLL